MFKLFISLVILFPAIVFADESLKEATSFINGLELQKLCNSESIDTENDCRLYVAGVIDSYAFLANTKNLENKICIPEEIALENLQSIVVQHLDEHSKDLHNTAAYIVLLAIRKTFPCKDDLHPHRF